VKGQGHQAALLTAVLAHQAAAAVGVGTCWPWETAAMLPSARQRKALRRQRRRTGAWHIVAAARLQLVLPCLMTGIKLLKLINTFCYLFIYLLTYLLLHVPSQNPSFTLKIVKYDSFASRLSVNFAPPVSLLTIISIAIVPTCSLDFIPLLKLLL